MLHFSSFPSKKILAGGLCAVALFFGANLSTTSAAEALIGMDRAKEIAVEKAGCAMSDVYFHEAELDQEQNHSEYEFEFCKGTTRYDVVVDAATGKVLAYGYRTGHHHDARYGNSKDGYDSDRPCYGYNEGRHYRGRGCW
ncbi:MAG: PepSY domain-containing protein [Succiniclasticum sp.]|jgi:hypothetical protein